MSTLLTGRTLLRASTLGDEGVKPLCWDKDGSLLSYAHGSLFMINGDRERKLCDLPLSATKKLLSHSRMMSRALRIEPRAALLLGDVALVAWMGSVLLVDVLNGHFKTVLEPKNGFSCPLYFAHATGGGLLAIWGDYGTNSNRAAVALWGLSSDGR